MELENRIYIEHFGCDGTPEKPMRIPIPRRNLENMTDEEITAAAFLLDQMGFKHARMVAIEGLFTITTSDGKSYGGTPVHDRGKSVEIRTPNGLSVIVLKEHVTAFCRTPPSILVEKTAEAEV